MKGHDSRNCRHTRAQSKTYLPLALKFWIMLLTRKNLLKLGSVLTKDNSSKYLSDRDLRKNIWMLAFKNVRRGPMYLLIVSIKMRDQDFFVICMSISCGLSSNSKRIVTTLIIWSPTSSDTWQALQLPKIKSLRPFWQETRQLSKIHMLFRLKAIKHRIMWPQLMKESRIFKKRRITGHFTYNSIEIKLLTSGSTIRSLTLLVTQVLCSVRWRGWRLGCTHGCSDHTLS